MPGRHLVLPERHRFAENSRFYSRRSQVCCRGKSIRTAPDDGYKTIWRFAFHDFGLIDFLIVTAMMFCEQAAASV